MLKAFGRHFKLGNRWDEVALDFCLLAWDALTRPLTYILFDIELNEFVCDGLFSPLNSGMAKAMNDIKDSTPVGERDEWTGWSIRDIDK